MTNLPDAKRELHPDFPTDHGAGAVEGVQPKLLLNKRADGIYGNPQRSPEELLHRYEVADDLMSPYESKAVIGRPSSCSKCICRPPRFPDQYAFCGSVMSIPVFSFSPSSRVKFEAYSPTYIGQLASNFRQLLEIGMLGPLRGTRRGTSSRVFASMALATELNEG